MQLQLSLVCLRNMKKPEKSGEERFARSLLVISSKIELEVKQRREGGGILQL